jgi:hypothetical protein
MRSRKYFLVICLLFIFSLSSFSVQAQTDQNELNDEFYQRIKNPTKVSEILEYFSKLKGSWKVYQEGELIEDATINYSYLGIEIIQETETEKISLEIINQENSSNLMYFWIGGEEIRQMEIDGQTIPKEMAAMMTKNVLETVFSPFLFLESMDIAKLREIVEISRSKEWIAGNEMNVITIESDNLAEMNLKSGMIKLADFDQFLIAAAFQYEALNSTEKVNFELEEIELR